MYTIKRNNLIISENMSCPMFVDSVRECSKKIGFIPVGPFDYYCQGRYEECPFYRTINNIGHQCEFIAKCPAYKHFQKGDLKKFVEMTNKFCLSEENKECSRYKMRETGQTPPENLLPDGTYLS